MKKQLLLVFAALIGITASAQTNKYTVVELHQAPGQFINVLPEADEETTQAEVCENAQESLEMNTLISLGTYGGYITVKFDQPVENKKGNDILIKGNGFYAASDPVYGSETIGGSIEPGIVYVGVGSDPATAEWYELAGSEYFSSEVHDFKITYFKPESENASDYIRWECSWTDANGTKRDSTGYHPKNTTYHNQSYWPQYEGKDELTFEGGRVPNNAIDQSGKGTYWVQYRYSADAYGYVDACPTNDSLYSSFDISWAVDKNGRPVALDKVDFVRVATGIFQYCGWLGETSTEVSDFADLHSIPGYDDNPYVITPRENPYTDGIKAAQTVRIAGDDAYYNILGQRMEHLVKGQIYIHNGKKMVY
jgi:hypothetical protein